MKLLAALIITVSLAFGAIASTTAYLPSLDDIRAEDALTLNAPAGADAAGEPLARAGDLLDEALLEELAAAGVRRVRVREFSLGRWDAAKWFGLCAIGLVVGAVMMRRAARLALAAGTDHPHRAGAPPNELIHAARAEVADLLRGLPALDERGRLKAIVSRLDALRTGALAQFADARPAIVARMGVGGYAHVMDVFAAAERQLNRAWSAAADHVPIEAVRCLETALPMLDETLARLAEGFPTDRL